MNMKHQDVDWRTWVIGTVVIVLLIMGSVWWVNQTPIIAR
jgi:heme/copper-type cytochrome/quinol oxidase subunit 4